MAYTLHINQYELLLKNRINRKVILENYDKYKNPAELIIDSNLNKDEKILLLKQWLLDEESLSRASDEGLIGTTRSDILKQVKKALITMEENLN